MTQTETVQANETGRARTRIPHVAGLFAGVTILAATVLLWTGQPDNQVSSGRTALGSTVSVVTLDVSAEQKTTTGSKSAEPAASELPESTPASPIRNEDAASSSELSTSSHHAAILGTWKQYSHGHRLLKVEEGGTATIDVKLDGLSALAFGEKMRIDIEWQIDGDTLTFKTTGGSPEASVNAVTSIYGNDRVYQILEINEKQMLLQEGDEKKTPWDRVNDDEAKP